MTFQWTHSSTIGRTWTEEKIASAAGPCVAWKGLERLPLGTFGSSLMAVSLWFPPSNTRKEGRFPSIGGVARASWQVCRQFMSSVFLQILSLHRVFLSTPALQGMLESLHQPHHQRRFSMLAVVLSLSHPHALTKQVGVRQERSFKPMHKNPDPTTYERKAGGLRFAVCARLTWSDSAREVRPWSKTVVHLEHCAPFCQRSRLPPMTCFSG